MEIFWIILIIYAISLAISVSLTFFLVKGYEHLLLEKTFRGANEKSGGPESEVIKDQMRITLRKFYIIFFFLEAAIILYFIFLSMLLFK